MNALAHPALVHAPLGLMILAPILTLYTLYVIRKRDNPQLLYLTFFLFLLISIGAFLAVISGEVGEEILEGKISESVIESHEEIAEFFAILSYTLTVLSLFIIFLNDRLRQFALFGLFLLSVALLFTGIITGKRGGALVYEHNAPRYLMSPAPATIKSGKGEERHEDESSEGEEK